MIEIFKPLHDYQVMSESDNISRLYSSKIEKY